MKSLNGLHPSRIETWSQEVLYSNWQYQTQNLFDVGWIDLHVVRFVEWFLTDLEKSYIENLRRQKEIQAKLELELETDKKKISFWHDSLMVLSEIEWHIVEEGKVYSDIEDQWERWESRERGHMRT
jgi:hypothetical protein